jgi:type II secretory pathway component PulF
VISSLDDSRHRAEFYRMWSAGHSAGLSHPASLENMGERESAAVEDMRRWLLAGTRRGADLATLVKTGGARFEDFERALLTLGAESGRLDQALQLLAGFYTKKHQLMLWIRKKMVYPAFTLLAACFVAPLPLLVAGNTAAYVVIALSGVALIALNSAGLIAAAAARYGRRPPLARARMARALATAVEAGLPLPRAVRLAAEASAHSAIRQFVARLDERRLATSPVSESLAGCPHLTPEFVAILATAEHTGDYTPLSRLAELYEDGFR